MIEKLLKLLGYVKIDKSGAVTINVKNEYPIGKLSHHQILTLLGFDVPENGIYVNQQDRELYVGTLRLLGKTISIDTITDEDILKLRSDWHPHVEVPDAESVPRMRGFMTAILGSAFKFKNA